MEPETKVSVIRYQRTRHEFKSNPTQATLANLLVALELYKRALRKETDPGIRKRLLALPDPIVFQMQLQPEIGHTLVKDKKLDHTIKLVQKYRMTNFKRTPHFFSPSSVLAAPRKIATQGELNAMENNTALLTNVYDTESIDGHLYWIGEIRHRASGVRVVRAIPYSWIKQNETLVNPNFEVEQIIGTAVLPNSKKVTILKWRGMPDLDFV